MRDTGNLVYLSQQKWGDGPWHEAPSKLFEVARRFYKLCLLAFISSACRSWHMSGLPMQDNFCKMPAHPIGSQWVTGMGEAIGEASLWTLVLARKSSVDVLFYEQTPEQDF